jgi:hypothetical protein
MHACCSLFPEVIDLGMASSSLAKAKRFAVGSLMFVMTLTSGMHALRVRNNTERSVLIATRKTGLAQPLRCPPMHDRCLLALWLYNRLY